MPENVAPPSAPAPAAIQPTNVPNQGMKTENPGTGQENGQPGPPKTIEDWVEVKINGQSRKYSKEQAAARLALEEGAREKFETASQKEKKVNDWKEQTKKDFMKTLMDPELGLTKEQIRSRFENWYKENFIDPETMTPEQRELNELRREREERKKLDEEAEDNKKKTIEERETQQQYQSVQQEIIETLEKSNLPKTRFFAHRIAFFKAQNIAKGYDAPPEVIIDQVKTEGKSVLAALAQEASVEQLLEQCPDLVKKIRRYDMENLKKRFEPKQTVPTTPIPGANGANRKTGERGGKSMRDVDNYFNNLRRSR